MHTSSSTAAILWPYTVGRATEFRKNYLEATTNVYILAKYGAAIYMCCVRYCNCYYLQLRNIKFQNRLSRNFPFLLSRKNSSAKDVNKNNN